MSGIYIPGMDMPKKIEPGLVVEFAEGIDGKRYARLHHYRYGSLTDWLETVPVPSHGRLIDADALEEYTDDKYSLHEIGRHERDTIIDSLRYCAPTIIEAEEGE